MQTQRLTLLDQLPKHGWDVVHIEEVNLEWWADEMWTLDSVWSPVGSRAYLTFLVDPQSASRNRKKGQGVWAVKASKIEPQQWLSTESEFDLSLGRNWLNDLPDFLERLSALRH